MISVVIPLYNKEASIAQSLGSVLSQSFRDFEVVIVDDGSTDGSVSIVESMTDPRIRLIKQENGGPSKARNTGVKNARGEWILFLDADDELLPGALQLFADTVQQHSDCNFLDFSWYVDNGKERLLADHAKEGIVKNPFKSYFYGEIVPRTGSFVCSRELALTCLFDEQLRRFEDDEMLFKVFNLAKMYYQPTPSMVCNQKYAAASRGRADIQEDFLGHLNFTGKSFWERMCLYKMFLGERPYYDGQCRKMYPSLYKRYDLLLLQKLLQKLNVLFR